MKKIKEYEKFDDHLFVALSIIIGLAITSALENWADILKNLSYIQLSHQHLFWAAVAFYWAIQYWWGLWKYQDIQWNFLNFLLFLFIAVSIFLLNDLIYPDIEKGEAISFTDYYFDIHSWYFSVLSILILLIIIRSIRVAKRAVKDKVNILYYFALFLSISAAISSSPAFHNIGIAIGVILILIIASRGALKLILPDKK